MKIKLKNSNVKPVLGSSEAAGLDLKADAKEQLILAGKEYTFCTGVALEIPKGWVGLLLPRSSFGSKHGMRILNTCGVIDSDYRGYIKVACTFNKDFWLQDYSRLVQLVVVPHFIWEDSFEYVTELDDTERGSSGFGSTGTV